MVRRCFPVAKIVGSSPTGVVFLGFFLLFFFLFAYDVMLTGNKPDLTPIAPQYDTAA
jgi:hypothetical protein